MSEEWKPRRGLEVEEFADIVEGRRRCLTCEQLAIVVRCADTDCPKGQNEEALVERYRRHIGEDCCLDCQELYDALVIVSKAASCATNDAVRSA